MIPVKSYGVDSAQSPVGPLNIERRALNTHDILIDILYCGVCHTDIHQVRNEWNNSMYPMVPGHEIVGKVIQLGNGVKHFKIGDIAAVGCLVDACRICNNCQSGFEQYCEQGISLTYNSFEQDGQTVTYGGYSEKIVVDESFVLKVNGDLDLAGVAPLLCAGITTYSPLRHWQAGPGKKVGVIGLGGLGHMAVKFAHHFGAEVILFTTSPDKKADAIKLGADHVVISKNEVEMAEHHEQLDLIINTVSADIDLNQYLQLLKLDGTLVLLGLPSKNVELQARGLISKRRKISGSLIGGIAQTQEMLDYCAMHNITSDVEIIPIDQVNVAFERMLKGDVKYRFVIDMASLKTKQST